MAHQARAVMYPGCIELSFPYRPDLIDEIKRRFPAMYRSWDPVRKVWVIRLPYADHALALLRSFYPDALVIEAHEPRQDVPRPRQPLAGAEHFTALALLPSAPPPVVNAAYRAWVKLCHPDALPAGERPAAHQRMCAINAAYEALCAEGAA